MERKVRHSEEVQEEVIMAVSKNIYSLPFNKKDLVRAVSNPKAHYSHFKEAIDFILPEGSFVLAAKTGVVIDIKDCYKKGGKNVKYANKVNYITIKHSNNEFSQYVHIKYKGMLVKVGDKVKEKQPIALSGNTGFSTAPHLHFHVLKFNSSEIGWESLKPRFKDNVRVYKS